MSSSPSTSDASTLEAAPTAAPADATKPDGPWTDHLGRLWSPDGTRLCGLGGCCKPAWHSGLCEAVLGSRRGKKPVQAYDAGADLNSRELIKRARDKGRLPPAKVYKKKEPQQHEASAQASGPKQPRKRREGGAKGSEGGAVKRRAENVEPERKVGCRGGTRSHGAPVWQADAEHKVDPVSAALTLADGRVALRLHVRVLPSASSRGPKELQDFLAKGANDKAANESVSSESWLIAAERTAARGVRWGCLCAGSVLKGGIELTCRRCALTFHAKCERLDYSNAELKRMEEKGTYTCSECEQAELRDAGYDPALGRFVWKCRHCTRSFEAEDHKAAEFHGSRCASQLSKRQWSCACAGKLPQTAMATQCKDCGLWYHASCKSQHRNSWDAIKSLKDCCASCERTAFEAKAGGGKEAKRSTAIDRAEKVSAGVAAQQLPGQLPATGRDEVGTLADKRVDVRKSTLGECAGLGLFAAIPIGAGEVISSYHGTLVYREALAPGTDTSYIVRLPDAGGALINGKPYADAIRANPANPREDGCHYPIEGAAEWHVGAGAMANDPRDQKLYNARLNFVKVMPSDDG